MYVRMYAKCKEFSWGVVSRKKEECIKAPQKKRTSNLGVDETETQTHKPIDNHTRVYI